MIFVIRVVNLMRANGTVLKYLVPEKITRIGESGHLRHKGLNKRNTSQDDLLMGVLVKTILTYAVYVDHQSAAGTHWG